MSAHVDTRRLPLRAREYRTAGTPNRMQSLEAMTSFMGSWPVRPDLTSSLLPVALSIVQRLGRSPPVDTSGGVEADVMGRRVRGEQDLAQRLVEGIVEEVDVLPFGRVILASDPVLVRQAQTVGPVEQLPGRCRAKRFEHAADAVAGGGMARDLHHSSILLAYSALLPCVVNSRGRRSWSRTSPEEHARPDSGSYSNARTGWSPHIISLRGMIPLPSNLVFKRFYRHELRARRRTVS